MIIHQVLDHIVPRQSCHQSKTAGCQCYHLFKNGDADTGLFFGWFSLFWHKLFNRHCEEGRRFDRRGNLK